LTGCVKVGVAHRDVQSLVAAMKESIVGRELFDGFPRGRVSDGSSSFSIFRIGL
jgi:hypothetical protein